LLTVPAHFEGPARSAARQAEVEARRAIEDRCGLIVHDANVLLQANCQNIDLVVLGPAAPIYVQVKSSEKPASKNHVTVNGAPWTERELYHGEPIFNRHPGWRARLVFILDRVTPDLTDYYIAPALEHHIRSRAELRAARPKRDGQPRSNAFRKELPRIMLSPWKNAWHMLTGELPPKVTA
jgi:hypothetical protein